MASLLDATKSTQILHTVPLSEQKTLFSITSSLTISYVFAGGRNRLTAGEAGAEEQKSLQDGSEDKLENQSGKIV